MGIPCFCAPVFLPRPFCMTCKGGDTTGETARVLIEDVHDAIYDLVELIKTFQSKNKLSKVFLSTLFKRRQEELDAVVDRAIMRLQVGGFFACPFLAHLELTIRRFCF